jgi:plasmid stabilization system protein ParE
MRIHHLLGAEREILEAVQFYHERAGDLASEFYAEFCRARSEIAAFPEFWGNVGGGYRRKLLSRFPYGIIYRIEDEEILIVAVAHLSRHPDYWRNRG